MSKDSLFNDVGDADVTINPHRFVGFSTTAGKKKQADTATEAIVGVSDEFGVTVTDAAADNRFDYKVIGYAKLEYGGTIAAGAHLTTDADGKGVTASAGNRIGAMSHEAGVAGDIRMVTLIAGSPVL